jgi:hypothetical protein
MKGVVRVVSRSINYGVTVSSIGIRSIWKEEYRDAWNQGALEGKLLAGVHCAKVANNLKKTTKEDEPITQEQVDELREKMTQEANEYFRPLESEADYV